MGDGKYITLLAARFGVLAIGEEPKAKLEGDIACEIVDRSGVPPTHLIWWMHDAERFSSRWRGDLKVLHKTPA